MNFEKIGNKPNFQPAKMIKQSPMFIAKQMLTQNTDNISIRNTNPKQCPTSALSIYNIFTIPTNHNVITTLISQSNIALKTNKLFVDGSCLPSPGEAYAGTLLP